MIRDLELSGTSKLSYFTRPARCLQMIEIEKAIEKRRKMSVREGRDRWGNRGVLNETITKETSVWNKKAYGLVPRVIVRSSPWPRFAEKMRSVSSMPAVGDADGMAQ